MTPAARREPEITDQEWDLIVELLDAKRVESPAEIHHTSTSAYRQQLRQRIELIEGLLAKRERFGAEGARP